jgi:hypothetical protein
VFLFSRATGTTLVSAVTGASSTGAGGSSAPAIDGDGGKVVYLSSAADLVANQEPGTTTTNVYLYAAPLGDNFLITGQFGSATVPGNGDASNALISRQSYPLLSSVATDLVPGVGAHSNGFLNKLISTNLLLTGPALRGGTGPNALVGTFRTTVTFAGQYRPPTYSLVAGYGDDGLFQVPGAGSALYTGAQAIDYTGRSSFGVEVQTDVGLAPLYGLDYLLIPATPTTSVPPPPPPVPRSITAHLVPLKVGKRKVRLVVEVLFADTGALKKEFLAPFQGPGFRAIQVSVRDAADVAAAEVVVSARKGKRTVTASYPD